MKIAIHRCNIWIFDDLPPHSLHWQKGIFVFVLEGCGELQNQKESAIKKLFQNADIWSEYHPIPFKHQVISPEGLNIHNHRCNLWKTKSMNTTPKELNGKNC
jgi:hypothetical protein